MGPYFCKTSAYTFTTLTFLHYSIDTSYFIKKENNSRITVEQTDRDEKTQPTVLEHICMTAVLCMLKLPEFH